MSRHRIPHISKCDDKKGSLYFYLKSYKPIVSQQYRDNTPRSIYKSKFQNLNKTNQNRRRSCYCSECGTQSQFQYKTQHIPLYKAKKRQTLKKSFIVSPQKQSSQNPEQFSKKSSILSSRRQSRFAHLNGFRESIVLANFEEKLQLIAEQKQKKSSFCNLDQLNTFRILSQPQSPIRKISQPTKPLFENYSLKSLTQRSPNQRDMINTQNKKYQNVYLIPLPKKNMIKCEKQQICLKTSQSHKKEIQQIKFDC